MKTFYHYYNGHYNDISIHLNFCVLKGTIKLKQSYHLCANEEGITYLYRGNNLLYISLPCEIIHRMDFPGIKTPTSVPLISQK